MENDVSFNNFHRKLNNIINTSFNLVEKNFEPKSRKNS